MKKVILNTIIFLGINFLYAQSNIKMKDIKLEDNVIYYMGAKQFIIEDRMLMTEVFIKDTNNAETIITMVIRKAPAPEGVTQYNKDGMDTYYEFTYVPTNYKCDYRPGLGKKSIAKDMLYYGIFENGIVNEDNVNKFINLKGAPYTARNNKTTIIIHN